MKKFIFLSLFSLLLVFSSYAQLTKGNWLIGGNANFSSARYSNSVALSYTQTNLQITPAAGYFLIDKLAVGLRPGYTYNKNTNGTNNYVYNTYSIGPFVRYYFLHSESRANIFSEVSYQHVISKTTDNPSNSTNGYSFLAGPVIYFNSSVGIEFTVGYSTYKYSGDTNSKNSTIQVGIGLQVHLEKDKK